MSDIITTETTGSTSLAYTLNPGFGFELVEFTLHLGSTPVTSENFTATKNADAGVGYDTLIYSKDLSTIAADIYFSCEPQEIVCEAGDQIDFAFTNTDTVVYGLQIKYRRLV